MSPSNGRFSIALVMPRAQIEVLAAAQFGNPRGATLVEILVVPTRNRDELNGRDAVEAVEVADLVFDVFDEFPFAIPALEIRRRQAGEH